MAREADLTELQCSRCGKPGAFDLKDVPGHFPFCSMRCKTLDLGEWLEPPEDEGAGEKEAADNAPKADENP